MFNINELKDNLTDYTEAEFFKILCEFTPEKIEHRTVSSDEMEEYLDKLLDKLMLITGSEYVGDYIYYPESSDADCPEGVLNEVKKWRKSQGLPLFKDTE
ncbi:bacteriocin immunity protein [Kluyvera ascorbata]